MQATQTLIVHNKKHHRRRKNATVMHVTSDTQAAPHSLSYHLPLDPLDSSPGEPHPQDPHHHH